MYIEGAFPSEPTFVPRDGESKGKGEEEDDGFLVFTLTEGVKEEGHFVILDAKVSGASLPFF